MANQAYNELQPVRRPCSLLTSSRTYAHEPTPSTKVPPWLHGGSDGAIRPACGIVHRAEITVRITGFLVRLQLREYNIAL
jgi:hypothetical protein